MLQIDRIVDDIEKCLYNSLDEEVTSHKIGDMVMERLKEVDEVAYIRFAAVYRQFKDSATFFEEMNKIFNNSGIKGKKKKLVTQDKFGRRLFRPNFYNFKYYK